MDRIDTSAVVQTPERVGFRFRVAGPGQRGAAWALDVLIQGLALSLGLIALSLVGAVTDPGVSGGLVFVTLFVVTWFYAAIFEVLWAGRTPGKVVMGLRVVHGDGAPITVRGAVLRNLARGVDGLPVLYAVGVIACVADRSLRRLGDLIADTVVVVDRPVELHGSLEVDPPLTEEERRALPVAVHLSRREQRAIERLLHRRDRLSPDRAEELAGYLAPALSARTGVSGTTSLRALTLAWARATGRG